MNNILISNCVSSYAINADVNSVLTISNSKFMSSTTKLFLNSGAIILNNVTFNNIYGAAYLSNNNSVLNGCVFNDISSNLSISVVPITFSGSYVSVSNTVFSNIIGQITVTPINSGLSLIYFTNLTVTNCNSTNQYNMVIGGSYNIVTYFNNSIFSNNINGPALGLENPNATTFIDNCSFNSNSGGDGAIDFWSTNLTITNSQFLNNVGYDYLWGGAIAMGQNINNMMFFMQNTTLINNTNVYFSNGGALSVYCCYENFQLNMYVNNCTFLNNSGYNGGVFYVTPPNIYAVEGFTSYNFTISTKIYNSIMKFNTGYTNSVFSFTNSSLDLENNIIEDNIVNYTYGYAIGCLSGNFTSKNNVLIGNTASGIEMDISCFDCYSFMSGAPPSCACPNVNVATQCATCLSGFNQSLGCADCNSGLFGPTCTGICSDCNGNGNCSSGILGNGACICDLGYNPSNDCAASHKSSSNSIKSKFILQENVTLLLFLSIILSIYNKYFSL